jgi:hypothetical protein
VANVKKKPGRRSPVKKYMDRLTRPATHRDKTKYRRSDRKKIDYDES